MAMIAFICTLSQSVITIAKGICRLCFFTKLRKKVIVASVLLDDNIHVTGTPAMEHA